ncbi:MAG: YihA family ribosome biogenesis GTP-binding protein [Rikenellaceae bacterium]|jgi:GTP-binding protein|nr:YihA family ribosome biogenesis GTP-binding protein [Rikenellaceae bacterium]MBO5874791.1 YihA family ribosome biogenesis GTP-binding protein [Rikenellaceae bacterium]MBR5000296.1 YihA family ribosome biogenesis GTP-binding protein [Rikenellaceae bacterium]
MEIKSAQFKCSSQFVDQCPSDGRMEFAFIGRSNVGKSSLINMLTNQKGLAKVSATPGKTQLINHFLINDQWYMVDLPGYGYARVSKDQRKGFSTMITKYILEREPMTFLFLLVDSRHEPQKIDLEFIQFLGENSVPFGIVFTKCDKLSQNKVESGVALYRRVLKKTWDELPIMFLTSSEKKMGKEALLEFVESCLENANQ